jgi:hypothetical protein
MQRIECEVVVGLAMYALQFLAVPLVGVIGLFLLMMLILGMAGV